MIRVPLVPAQAGTQSWIPRLRGMSGKTFEELD
jgi:hypothetical protein